jgi:hypothetical protein
VGRFAYRLLPQEFMAPSELAEKLVGQADNNGVDLPKITIFTRYHPLGHHSDAAT